MNPKASTTDKCANCGHSRWQHKRYDFPSGKRTTYCQAEGCSSHICKQFRWEEGTFPKKLLIGFQGQIYYDLLNSLGRSWTISTATGGMYKRGKHVTSKLKARAIAVRYFLTYSKKGLC